MSGFQWVMRGAEGNELSRSQTFDTQAEAESWLSGEWAALAEQGAASVALVEDETMIYEMGLGAS